MALIPIRDLEHRSGRLRKDLFVFSNSQFGAGQLAGSSNEVSIVLVSTIMVDDGQYLHSPQTTDSPAASNTRMSACYCCVATLESTSMALKITGPMELLQQRPVCLFRLFVSLFLSGSER